MIIFDNDFSKSILLESIKTIETNFSSETLDSEWIYTGNLSIDGKVYLSISRKIKNINKLTQDEVEKEFDNITYVVKQSILSCATILRIMQSNPDLIDQKQYIHLVKDNGIIMMNLGDLAKKTILNGDAKSLSDDSINVLLEYKGIFKEGTFENIYSKGD